MGSTSNVEGVLQEACVTPKICERGNYGPENMSDGSMSLTPHRQGKDQAQGLPAHMALTALLHH